jgi:hypothetical protein
MGSQINQGFARGSFFEAIFLANISSFFRSYTILVKHELADNLLKAPTQIAQIIRRGGIEQLKHVF